MPDKKEKKKKVTKPPTEDAAKNDTTGSSSKDEMGTLFLMDLLRQKTEKDRREKKDIMIRQMALEQKQRKEEGKQKNSSYPAMGGFVGIEKLTGNRTPVMSARRKKELEIEEPDRPVEGDNQMFILGLLKEQSQQKKDKERIEVNERSVLCVSDENQIKKFCQ